MRSRTLTALAAVACLTTAVAIADGPPAQTGPLSIGKGTFSAACTFSHRAADDPIVYPGVAGAAHSHDFMGARSTDAFSTLESLRASDTTCIRHGTVVGRKADTAAYWVPTLIVNDQPVTASDMTANYVTGSSRYQQAIRAFPDGLKMLTGAAVGNPGEIQGRRVWYFECGDTQLAPPMNGGAPTCTSKFVLYMDFPDCWDGVNLDSANHRSHMAYSTRPQGQAWICPPSHPWVMPKLELRYRFNTQAGPTTRFSSGPMSTAHADFFNGWREGVMPMLVANCLNVDRYCGGGDQPVGG